jgi:hypothetical protein
VVIVTSIEFNGSALKAVIFGTKLPVSLLFADIASKFDDFFFLAARTDGYVVVGTIDISKDVVHVALLHHTSLFISCNLLAVIEAVHADSKFALFVKIVFIGFSEASHAS